MSFGGEYGAGGAVGRSSRAGGDTRIRGGTVDGTTGMGGATGIGSGIGIGGAAGMGGATGIGGGIGIGGAAGMGDATGTGGGIGMGGSVGMGSGLAKGGDGSGSGGFVMGDNCGGGGNFVEALEKLFIRRSTPKPTICSNVNRLPQFFKQFENYARTQYGDDTELWMQAIGEFVAGEVSHIVSSFGEDVQYFAFKARVLKEFVEDTRVTGDTYKNILEMKRNPLESLKCFHLRVENLVKKIDTKPDNREALILCALRNNVQKDVLYQVDLQLSLLPGYSVERFIAVCGMVNNTMAKTKEPLPPSKSDFVRTVEKPLAPMEQNRADTPQRSVTCYNCGEQGHLSRNCPNRPAKKCFKCHRSGHIAKDCNFSQQSDGRSARPSCGFCGRFGHIMKDCREFRDVLSGRNSSPSNGGGRADLN